MAASYAIARYVEYARNQDKITGMVNANGNGTLIGKTREDPEVLCGPLLNYKGMREAGTASAKWYGSVLLVTKPGHYCPTLKLRCMTVSPKPAAETELGSPPGNLAVQSSNEHDIPGERLYEDLVKTFWRFDLVVSVQGRETRWEYTMASLGFISDTCHRTRTFIVPSITQSMRIVFHSCNAFSIGANGHPSSSPVLWNDVIRMHKLQPFHVMIGGGDQIYNDGVRAGEGPLQKWTNIADPKTRRDWPFDEDLRLACDTFYCNSYMSWYSTEPFASVNGEIPQVNVWNGHDIIDGFGNYADHFMRCAVVHGIGGMAFKYYCLFQHHVPPPASISWGSITTQPPDAAGTSANPRRLSETFILQGRPQDECFIMGRRSGSYINECSRSLYLRLGARIGFLGIDARTERTRHQINYENTYELILTRMQQELSSPGPSKITHLIVLLSVPIAYPRLNWLDNFIRSPIKGPIRSISRQFGIAGGRFNQFDRQGDRSEDLGYLYTAPQHKHERKYLILKLQELAQMYNVRITILSGDVHLAAVGCFYANPKLGIPVEEDHRYMPNVISSAITDQPSPRANADLLARRNKIYHLDHDTEETLMNIWDEDAGDVAKIPQRNKVTMPSRNYAILSESPRPPSYSHATDEDFTNALRINGRPTNVYDGIGKLASSAESLKGTGKEEDGRPPLHPGVGAPGTSHRAATGVYAGKGDGALDVCFRVEIDPKDMEGKTKGYGFTIPALKMQEVPVIVDYPGSIV